RTRHPEGHRAGGARADRRPQHRSRRLALVGQTMELRHRLPKLWELVQDLTLPAWQARRAAAETMNLSREAAGFADRHLAVAAGTVRAVAQQARCRCDPDHAHTLEEQALGSRGVWFDPSPDTPAITYLSATLDTLTALALDQTVSGLACTIGRLGDQTSLNVRRATALGMLADPQHVLDLTTGTDRPVGWSRQARPTGPATLYLHVDARDLEAGTGGG